MKITAWLSGLLGHGRRCETCRFCEQTAGQCRRYAPREYHGVLEDPCWPYVQPSRDWCGEWQLNRDHRIPDRRW